MLAVPVCRKIHVVRHSVTTLPLSAAILDWINTLYGKRKGTIGFGASAFQIKPYIEGLLDVFVCWLPEDIIRVLQGISSYLKFSNVIGKRYNLILNVKMTEDDNWDEDLEEDAAIARVFQHLSIDFYYFFSI